ncbi:MAG: SAM-dependent methyltransferase [Deltaproteobacteria bacterium]|nr:SAM-dependent methyltransferase [Deltaproteobacteria bacterium]
MLYASISLLSAAALGYEVLLLRLFSIAQWHHLAYMAISLALLGCGASGTFLSLTQDRLLRHFEAAFAAGACLFGISALGSFSLSQSLRFSALELAWDPRQLLHLLATYLLLAVPFFAAAGCVGLAFTSRRGQIRRIYLSDLLGAGLGAAAVVLALFLLRPTSCLRILGAAGFLAAGLSCLGAPRPATRTAGAWAALLGLLASAAWPDAWLAPRISEYKGLSQALRMPGARVLAERSSPLGLLAVVSSPRVPFRYAPGLSLACPLEPPEQLGVFADGDAAAAIPRYRGRPEEAAYLDWGASALPYHLLIRPRVLLLGAGGGSEVLLALREGASSVDAVELNPQLIELVRAYPDFAGAVLDAPGVTVHAAEARSYVRRSQRRYDLIQVPLLDAFGASAAAVYALNENYLYTVEALGELWDHLAPGGILAVTRWLALPPRDTLKLVATAAEALERRGIRDPGSRLALVRSWDTATLLLKREPLASGDIARIRAFCRDRWFDTAHYPGMPAGEADRYNRLETSDLREGVLALLGPGRADFLRRYKFYVAPATDDRPYFYHFFRWRALPELWASRGRGGVPLMEWGYLTLVATLAQAVVVGFALILLPLLPRWGAGRAGREAGHETRRWAYFAALGFAFLFLEVAFLQRFTLFLGHPLYAAAAALSSFLAFAGLGSGASARVARGRVGVPVAGIAGLSAGYLLLLPPLFRALLPCADWVRILACVALVAPLAFFMGMPFPLGLERVRQRAPGWIPRAWAVNGWASMVSAPLATVLAIHFGFTAVVAAAVLLYVGAARWARGL